MNLHCSGFALNFDALLSPTLPSELLLYQVDFLILGKQS